MPNARLAERAPFFAEVDIVAAGLPAPRRVWGSDVSETGMFLQTTQPFRIGDRVSLRFDVAEREVHVRAAEVMWVRPFEPINVDGKLPGVGLKFVALDPPARAALRRFVQPQLADTQPESEPDPNAMVSLPPFSQPPLNISLPEEESSSLPDHVRVFRQTKPSPVTIGPKQVTSPPTMLIGWKFRKERDDQQLDLRFDDAAPEEFAHSSSERVHEVQPVLDVTSTPPEGVTRDGQHVGDTVIALDKEIEEGTIAIRQLPIVEERKSAPMPKRKSRALETAVALLVAGTVIGSGIGYATKRWERHEKRITATNAKHITPKTAIEIPSTNTVPAAPIAAPVEETAKTPSPSTSASPSTQIASVASNVIPNASPIPSKAEVRSVVDAEGELPMMKPDPVAETLTDGGPSTLLPHKHKMHTASIKVGDAEITHVFALESPARIVVDLNGGKLPKGTLEPGNGIDKIRFGHPSKGKGRVVVELPADKKPKDLRADIDAGVLTISFR